MASAWRASDEAHSVHSDIAVTSSQRGFGRQPQELRRTKSFGYNHYNLTAWCYLGHLAANAGMEIWTWEGERGQSIQKGLDYLVKYLPDPESWPHREIKGVNMQTLFPLLRMCARAYPAAGYEARIDQLPKGRKATLGDRLNLYFPPAPTEEE